MDEAISLAQIKFKEVVKDFLTEDELNEMSKFGTVMSGSVSNDWQSILGYIPERNNYYEIELYKPCEKKPFVEKIYARILVSRDRNSEQVEIIWKPEIVNSEFNLK